MRRFRFKPLPLTGAIMSALLGLHGPRALAQSLPANALPTNGQVVSGTGSITQSGSNMQVTQGSQRLVTLSVSIAGVVGSRLPLMLNCSAPCPFSCAP